MTWNDAWTVLNSEGNLEERSQQRTLSESIFAVTENGGALIGEAGTGTGKSFSYLLPLIYRVKAKEPKRCVVSTETTALQDQLIDKDLPFLHSKFGPFKYRSLKGRSHYLCTNRAPRDHGIVLRTASRDLGDGERRDVERVLGYRIDDDDWDAIRGDSDWCAQAKCAPEKCYSARARQLALSADIVVCNHALLRTHAEQYGDGGDGVLGSFSHLVVDEAHTLEKVLVDGWGYDMTPYERSKSMKSIHDALADRFLGPEGVEAEEAEKLMKDGFRSAVKLFTLLAQKSAYTGVVDDYHWKRQNFALSEQYLSGPQPNGMISALEEYELQGPGRFKTASDLFDKLSKRLTAELDIMEKGTRKIRKGINAAKRLSKICSIISESLETRDGIVTQYGVPYAVIADGWKAYKGEFEVRVRCVPLDVSVRAKETLWDPLTSITLVSATLSDRPNDFAYTLKSLGIDLVDKPLLFVTVNSPFDMAKQQLLYLTPEEGTQVDVPGAQYSFDELVRVLNAAEGRSLVLFTARGELDYAAEELQRRSDFSHQVLVQEKVSNKQVLVDEFKRDTSSVLLATKSFFTGVDFPGETCSVVVLAKYPLPQYNTLCRAQVAWWRKRGFPNWYEREGALVARQAVGRLIRSEKDHGVIALLDQRKGMHDKIVAACTGSYATNDVADVKRWLDV